MRLMMMMAGLLGTILRTVRCWQNDMRHPKKEQFFFFNGFVCLYFELYEVLIKGG
jgi:hypothetical protein